MDPTSLNHEATPQYTLTITISDPDGLTATQMITVDILDVNEAPVIQNVPATVTIAEDVIGKIPVFTVDVIDQDLDVIIYTVTISPHYDLFEIDPTGKFCLFDFENISILYFNGYT